MSTDVTMLLWSVALAFVQVVIFALGAASQVGLRGLASNREGAPVITGWAGRAERAHRNIIENLVLFSALVLIAQVTGKANAMTALGAQVFFWARVAYLGVYLAGIPWLRTGLWFVSIVGMIMIFWQLV